LSGSGRLKDFFRFSVESGVPADWLAGAVARGPLASFEGAARWVEHPYREGVVLVGDAAGDPSFGCGLSLTLRDVRVLSDELLATEDWHTAARRYAAEHDRYFGALHTVESWMTAIFFDLSPEGDRIRAHALPLLAQGKRPDITGVGPDTVTDDAARIALLGV
jgi:2-polyprenyl-6-methoxyphenol hydroxylase-like FAD-dependent oxidoreductase